MPSELIGTAPLNNEDVLAAEGAPGPLNKESMKAFVGVTSINAPALILPLLPTTIPKGSAKRTLPPILPFSIELRTPQMLIACELTRLRRFNVPLGSTRSTVLPLATLNVEKEL